ncbi:MAG TPA: hypothetical protein VNW30_08210 [Opitutaceae bacterium]|jgi:hypothetical protein|nr:hypothetical protein [Opitutaceae bacterium]
MTPSEHGKSSNNDKLQTSSVGGGLETWDSPQLIALDLGSAQGKYTMFNIESAPDNGPLPS